MAKVQGLDKLLKQLDQFGAEGQRLGVAVTNLTAENIVNKAKLLSPVNKEIGVGGQLRRSNSYTKAKVPQNTAIVFNNAPYAAYQNFGTGGLVDIPKGFEEIAAQFRGKGVKQVNIPATGFLTTPYIQEAAEYPKRLENAFKKLTRDFNNKK